jgi:hypothetical protein
MAEDQVQEIRKKSQAIVSRAESDESFRQKLVDDPEATLRAEGLDGEGITDFVRETGLADVAGYRMPGLLGDCGYTCNISNCGNSVLKAL